MFNKKNKIFVLQCLEVLEDHEESILKVFMQEVQPKDIEYTVCTKKAKYCDDTETGDDDDDDSEGDDHDEL